VQETIRGPFFPPGTGVRRRHAVGSDDPAVNLFKLGRASTITRDANAVQRGRIAQRVTNRLIGRAVSRAMRHVWR
jgi:hypothetical protein